MFNKDKTVSINTYDILLKDNEPASKDVFTVKEDGIYYVECQVKARSMGWGNQALIKSVGADINKEIEKYEFLDAYYSISSNTGFRTFSYLLNKSLNLKTGDNITVYQLYKNDSSNTINVTISVKITKIN